MRSIFGPPRRALILAGAVLLAGTWITGCGSGGSTAELSAGGSVPRYRVVDLGPAPTNTTLLFNRAGEIVAAPLEVGARYHKYDHATGQFTPTDSPGSIERFGPNALGQRLELENPRSDYRAKTLVQTDGARVDMANFGFSLSGYPPSHALGMNDAGQVFGHFSTKVPSDSRPEGYSIESRAFLWQDGDFRDLGTLGGFSTHARDINNRGQIVGYAKVAEPLPGSVQGATPPYRAFLYEEGRMTMLPVPSGAGWLLSAHLINERGQIVGEDDHRMFLWENGSVRDITKEGGEPNFGYPLALNERGQILGRNIPRVIAAGTDGTYPMPTHPPAEYFLYDRGRAHRVEMLLPAATPWTLGGVFGLNDRGEMLATMADSGAEDRWALLVPEEER